MNKKDTDNGNINFCTFFYCCCICHFIIIILALFFSVTYPEIQDATHIQSATCKTLNYLMKPYQCCAAIKCDPCKPCNSSSLLCNIAVANGVPGPCCGNTECCGQYCDKCVETYYDYNCKCSKQRTVPCHCRCINVIQHETCQVYCNTCYNYNITILITLKNTTQFTYIDIDSCITEQSQCVSNISNIWNTSSTINCFWNDISQNIQFEPVTYNQGVLIAIYIFSGLTFIIYACFFIGLVCCHYYKTCTSSTKKMYKFATEKKYTFSV
jgi:hypothetical protein